MNGKQEKDSTMIVDTQDSTSHDGISAVEEQVRDIPSSNSNVRWWSEEEDKRVLRKLDYHIVPFLFTTYLFAFLDRSNIGNAKVAGMNKDLHLSDSQYQWLLTIFYIAYIIFQFLLLCYKFIKPSKFMGTCVFIWGVAAVLQAAAFDWSGLMATRFFIGLSEAGYGTGVALYLSLFYPRQEIGYRFACFLVGAAVASAIAGSVAYGIQGAQHVGIAHWRLIFIVEAAPTIILGIIIFFFLPDSISSSKFLTLRERQIAEARLYRAKIDQIKTDPVEQELENAGKKQSFFTKFKSIFNANFNMKNGLDAIRDPISYVNAILIFIINVGFASIPIYLPTILSEMGYTALRAQAFSAPPYVGAFVLAVLLSYLADKIKTRGILLNIMTAVGIIGYFMLATIEDNHTRYGGVWLVVIGLFTFIPLCYAWLITNSSGESKRGVGLIIFGTVGQCGPVLGTRLFPATDSPYYKKGMYISAGLLVAAFFIEWAAIIVFFFINRKKDQNMISLQQQQSVGGANGTHQQFDDAEKQSANGSEQQESRPLRYELKLDLKTEQGIQEQHQRFLDIAENREKSIYYRYCL